MSIRPEKFTTYLTIEQQHITPGNVLVRTVIKDIGHIHIVSGSLVACDPAIIEDLPLRQRIPIGSFLVSIVIVHFIPQETIAQRISRIITKRAHGDSRIALASISIRDEVPHYWQYATRENSQNQGEEMIHTYSVDSATGSFMDREAAKEARADDVNLFEKVQATMENAQNEPAWANMCFINHPHLNMVTFNSGWGDGQYTTYIGYTRNHEVVRIVTDFNVV